MAQFKWLLFVVKNNQSNYWWAYIIMLGNKTHLVGLDIGSKTIKAAEVVATKKNQMLKNFAATDIPSGLIEDGAINDPET